MALSPHVEVEAAKFLQKLIQDSKDEPVKLATKLFVICQHMKLSGKEHSLPYQVISRAMETVLVQNGLDQNALRSSSLALASESLSADPNSQHIKPGNERRLSADRGSEKSKDKDVVGCSTPTEMNIGHLRSRTTMGIGKVQEEMTSILKPELFTGLGSSGGSKMATSGNDSSKCGPMDVSGSHSADLISHSTTLVSENRLTVDNCSAEVQKSKDNDVMGSSSLGDTDTLCLSTATMLKGKCKEEMPSMLKTGLFINEGSSPGCKMTSYENDSAICGPEDVYGSLSANRNSPYTKPGNESKLSVDKGNAELCKSKDNDGARSYMQVDTHALHLNRRPIMLNANTKEELSSLKPGLFVSPGSYGGCKITASESGSVKHAPKGIGEYLEGGRHLDMQTKDPIGSDVHAIEKGLECFSQKAPLKRKRATSEAISKDDHPQKIRQRKNLSLVTNEYKKEVVGRDCVSSEQDGKDGECFQPPCLAPKNDQPQVLSTVSSFGHIQRFASPLTCSVDEDVDHGNTSLLTKVGGMNNQGSQVTGVNFNGHVERDIKHVPKTKELSRKSDTENLPKLLTNELHEVDTKLEGTATQISEKTPSNDALKSLIVQKTELSCKPEHLQAKDSPGAQVKSELSTGGASVDNFGYNVSCLNIPGIDVMPNNGAQELQGKSLRLLDYLPGMESTEKFETKKFGDSHLNSSEGKDNSLAHGLQCSLQDSPQSLQDVSSTLIQCQTKVDTTSQASVFSKVLPGPSVAQSVVDSDPQVHQPIDGSSDQVFTSLSNGVGCNNAGLSPASSGKLVAIFQKDQAENASNVHVSMKEQHHTVAHNSLAVKEEMTPRRCELQSSIGVSDIGLQGSPKILGPEIQSISIKKIDGIHGAHSSMSALQIGQSNSRTHFHYPGSEDCSSTPINCQARTNLVCKMASSEQHQEQSRPPRGVDSSLITSSHELVGNMSAAFAKGAINSEVQKSEQPKMHALSAPNRSLDEHLSSSADKGEEFIYTKKVTDVETRVSSPMMSHRSLQDIGRHTSSKHQIGTALGQELGKIDAEASVEFKMLRDKKIGDGDHYSTMKSADFVNDVRSKLNSVGEGMMSGCSSSRSGLNQGSVNRRPLFPDSPFKDYQLKQLRAQCLVFLAFRNKIPPKALHLEVALDVSHNKNKEATHGTETWKKENNIGDKGVLSDDKAGQHHAKEDQGRKMIESKGNETEKPPTPKLTITSSCSGSPVEAESSSKELETQKKGKRKKYPRIDPKLTKEERKQVMAARRKAEAAEQAEEMVKLKRMVHKSSQRDSEPQIMVAGLHTKSQTKDARQDAQPQTNVEMAAFDRHQKDCGKLVNSNVQAAKENELPGSVSSMDKKLERASSEMLEVVGLHASTKENSMIADGRQSLETKITEGLVIDSQDPDGKKPVNTANVVTGSHVDGAISSLARNRVFRLPNGKFTSLEELSKSSRSLPAGQSTGVITKPENGGSFTTVSESIDAQSNSESYPQAVSSFSQPVGKQGSLDDQMKTSSAGVVNNGSLSLKSRFQDANQNRSLCEEGEGSLPLDYNAIPLKPEYTTVEKWILDQRKRKHLEEQNWAQKQRKTEAKIAVCFHHLKEVVSSSEDISAKTKSVIELKKLQLLQLQRRLRRDFLHDFFKPITSDIDISKSTKKNRPGRRIKQLERLELKMKEERQRRIRERQKEFFSDVEAHKEKIEDWYKIKRERCRGFNRYVKEFHKRKDRTYREKVERIQREKINLLKNNDVEGYLRMVQDAKSDRVKQLLKETEGYLQKLGLKLKEQKVTARRLESGMDENWIADEHNGNELASEPAEGNYQAQHYLESNEKYYLMAHSVKENICEQPYLLEGGKLREYQMNGLRWLVSLYNNNLNGILADEMGLGKTVQVIALICYLMEKKNDRGPFLVVVPSSVLSGWVSEISFWAPSICKIAYTGSPDERRRLFREKISHQKFNVLLTTYEYLMNKHDRPKLSKISWHYIIIDEGHRIKNASCKLNAELKHYHGSHRLLLTGTPLQNNLEELWALLNFLLPNVFNSSEDFSQWFSKPFENVSDNSPDQALLTEEENLLIINRLHQVLRPFMLRRLKHKVENQLPEKIERLVRCEASAYQKLLMKRVEENLGSLCHAKARSVNNTVMELRNICNHPYLSQLHTDEILRMLPPHFLPPVVRLCAKLETLDRILPKLKATNHRVLLFSTMTRLLDVMEEYLTWKGYQYLRLDGHTCGNDRGVLIEQFNRPNSDAFLFLLSIRAGGVGINLQAADTVIIFDTDWNPQVDLQAQARAHRIGQKRDVLVLRLETIHTVEEQVRAAAEHKLGVANQSITAGFFDNNTSAEDRREYLESLLRESKKEEVAPVLDDEALNYLLARSESEIDIFEAVDRTRHQEEQAKWLKLNYVKEKGGEETMPMPPRLVGEEELKPFIMAMQAYDTANSGVKKRLGSAAGLDTQHYGRGKRAREVRSYGDQLTEEEFERLCQAGLPDPPKILDMGKDIHRTQNAVQSGLAKDGDGTVPVKRGRGRPRKVTGPSLLPIGSGKCHTDGSSSGIQVSASVEEFKDLANSFLSPSKVQEGNTIKTAASSVDVKFETAAMSNEKFEIAHGATKSDSHKDISIEEIGMSHFEDIKERKNAGSSLLPTGSGTCHTDGSSSCIPLWASVQEVKDHANSSPPSKEQEGNAVKTVVGTDVSSRVPVWTSVKEIKDHANSSPSSKEHEGNDIKTAPSIDVSSSCVPVWTSVTEINDHANSSPSSKEHEGNDIKTAVSINVSSSCMPEWASITEVNVQANSSSLSKIQEENNVKTAVCADDCSSCIPVWASDTEVKDHANSFPSSKIQEENNIKTAVGTDDSSSCIPVWALVTEVKDRADSFPLSKVQGDNAKTEDSSIEAKFEPTAISTEKSEIAHGDANTSVTEVKDQANSSPSSKIQEENNIKTAVGTDGSSSCIPVWVLVTEVKDHADPSPSKEQGNNAKTEVSSVEAKFETAAMSTEKSEIAHEDAIAYVTEAKDHANSSPLSKIQEENNIKTAVSTDGSSSCIPLWALVTEVKDHADSSPPSKEQGNNAKTEVSSVEAKFDTAAMSIVKSETAHGDANSDNHKRNSIEEIDKSHFEDTKETTNAGSSLLSTGSGKCCTDGSSSGILVSASVKEVEDHADSSSPSKVQSNNAKTAVSSVEEKIETAAMSTEKSEIAHGEANSDNHKRSSIEEIDNSNFEDTKETSNAGSFLLLTVPGKCRTEGSSSGILVSASVKEVEDLADSSSPSKVIQGNNIETVVSSVEANFETAGMCGKITEIPHGAEDDHINIKEIAEHSNIEENTEIPHGATNPCKDDQSNMKEIAEHSNTEENTEIPHGDANPCKDDHINIKEIAKTCFEDSKERRIALFSEMGPEYVVEKPDKNEIIAIDTHINQEMGEVSNLVPTEIQVINGTCDTSVLDVSRADPEIVKVAECQIDTADITIDGTEVACPELEPNLPTHLVALPTDIETCAERQIEEPIKDPKPIVMDTVE